MKNLLTSDIISSEEEGKVQTMKKIYVSERNYIELNFFGYIMAKKYNYEKLYKKGEKIICRKYAFEIGDETDEDGLRKAEKRFVEDVVIVKRG